MARPLSHSAGRQLAFIDVMSRLRWRLALLPLHRGDHEPPEPTRVQATAGTAGVGSLGHTCCILFQKITGTEFQFVPYRGSAPAVQDLVAGQIDLTIADLITTLPQVRGGTIKAYAVAGKTRLAAVPDVPTAEEAGVPGLSVSFWHGLWAPKGTPNDIIARLNGAVADALSDASTRARLADLSQDLFPREQQTPQALAARHKAEVDRWWPIIKAAGIKVE